MTTNDTTASDNIHPHVAITADGVVYWDDATRTHYLAPMADWLRLAEVGDYSLWCSECSHSEVIDAAQVHRAATDHVEALAKEFGPAALKASASPAAALETWHASDICEAIGLDKSLRETEVYDRARLAFGEAIVAAAELALEDLD